MQTRNQEHPDTYRRERRLIQAGFTNEQTGALSDVLSKLLTRDEFQEFRHGEFQEFRHETSERFTKIEARLDGMDTRLDGMDTRLDGVDTRLNNLETRFGRMEDHLSELKNEMHKMSSRIFMAMISISVVAITAMLPATLYVITRFLP